MLEAGYQLVKLTEGFSYAFTSKRWRWQHLTKVMDKSAGNRAATKENKIILWGKQEVKRITQAESNKAAADKAAR